MKRLALAAACCILLSATSSPADIYSWRTGEVIPGTEGITPGPGVNLSWWNEESHNLNAAILDGLDLRYARFSQSWLTEARFTGSDLQGADFTAADLWSASFAGCDISHSFFANAYLGNANLTDAIVKYADFSRFSPDYPAERVISAGQLYSTASYKSGDLQGICLNENNLSAWNFAGKDLTNASLNFTVLANTVFTDACILGATFGGTSEGGLVKEQLYSTASYRAGTLMGVGLGSNILSGWDFAGLDLTSCSFQASVLTGASFTGAVVRAAGFDQTTARGFTNAQLYSTASYSAHDLRQINLANNNLSNWSFSCQDLRHASFYKATLTGTDFGLADLRGADLRNTVGTPLRQNTIWNDGTIAGLQLTSGEELVIRNDNMTITTNNSWTMTPGASLKMALEGNWLSVMNVGEGVTPDLGGTLALTFADGIDIAALLGTDFKLFNWNGRLTTGDCFDTIATIPGATWDTTRLYTDGVVTLTAIPEPVTFALLAFGTLFGHIKRKS